MPRILDTDCHIKMEIHTLRPQIKDGQPVVIGGMAMNEPTPGETVTVFYKPMTAEQKASCMVGAKAIVAGQLNVDRLKATYEAVRRMVKRVDGLFFDDEHKRPFAVEHDKDGVMTQKSLDQLLNSSIAGELLLTGEGGLAGGLTEIRSADGKRLPHVEIHFDQPDPEAASPN